MTDPTSSSRIDLPYEFLAAVDEIAHRDREFVDTHVLRHPTGSIIARVTEKVSDGKMSFALFREFDRRGATERSIFLAHRQIDAARALLTQLDRDLPRLEDAARSRRRIQRAG